MIAGSGAVLVKRPVAGVAPVLSAAPVRPHWLAYGDALRILGAVAVVVGHVCDMVVWDGACQKAAAALALKGAAHLTDPERIAALNWWVANCVDAACRWAVPAYVMLSGALLLDPTREYQPRQFYSKRIWHVGIPTAFWSAFFLCFGIYYTQWIQPQEVWPKLLYGEPYAHLHYMFRIAGLYAITPMLRLFVKNASRSLFTLAVVLALAVGCADSLTEAYLGTKLNVFLKFLPFVGYYLAGYWLRDTVLSRRALITCWLWAVASAAWLALGSGWLIAGYGLNSQGTVLYDFLSPVRIIFALCAWLLIVNMFNRPWPDRGWHRFLARWVAPATLGLYLMHPAFREILHLGIHPAIRELTGVNSYWAAWPNIWLGIPLVSALVYLPSLLLALVLMKIPLLKRVVS